MALGLALGSAILIATVYGMLLGDPPMLPLLSNYLTGYAVSPAGALAGFAWGFFMGFVAGWFVAFCRNFFIAASIWLVRTRAELRATRDFLDHI
jgi:hypothetical protein